MRLVGTVSRGIRCPIAREGDDMKSFVIDAVLAAAKEEGFSFHDRDVVCVTEAVIGRAQGNYANLDQMSKDIKAKFPEGTLGVFNPILSRNRFSLNLKAMARACKKLVIQFTYPSDEVGNELISYERLEKAHINPLTDTLTEKEFRDLFGESLHPFTAVDYIDFYRELIEDEGAELEVVLANDPRKILEYTKQVLTCDIHTRERTKRILKQAGAEKVLGLDDIMTESVDGSGYNETYGLLGSNKATEDKVKLFPRDVQGLVEDIAAELKEKTGKNIEVMVYGDGAYKDPFSGIWEFADPVVSPAYTKGLEGVPNELKLKYLADNDFGDLSGEELREAIKGRIKAKDMDLKGKMDSEGTTPRHLTDLLGSLADLTSGSGDKGTPVVLVQGYFDNYNS